MRSTLTTSLALALVIAAVAAGSAGSAGRRAASGRHVPRPALAAAVRVYRQVTWTYERIAHARRTPSTGRSASPAEALAAWTGRAERARRSALAALGRTLGIELPVGPGPAAPAARQAAYTRHLVELLEALVPAPARAARTLASARPVRRARPASLAGWQRLAAEDAGTLARLAPRPLVARDSLHASLLCIHRYEGSWTAATGNGYYGGLQMDLRFQATYGRRYLERWGTADHWPVWAQIATARRAYGSGRGFGPWPNTARACGL